MSRLIPDEVWATLTIWQEARGEPYEGKAAVAEVILTRMRRKYLSDGTVVGTVLKPWQFSCWNTDDPNRLHAAVLDDADGGVAMCRQAWRDALAGSSVVPGAVQYYNPNGVPQTPSWADASKLVGVVGAHRFYTG